MDSINVLNIFVFKCFCVLEPNIFFWTPCINLKNTQLLYPLPFHQFLSNFYWNHDDEPKTLRGNYLKTCHLRFFSSENRKSPKNCLLSDDVLKICIFLFFGPQNCKKLFFFSEIITTPTTNSVLYVEWTYSLILSNCLDFKTPLCCIHYISLYPLPIFIYPTRLVG